MLSERTKQRRRYFGQKNPSLSVREERARSVSGGRDRAVTTHCHSQQPEAFPFSLGTPPAKAGKSRILSFNTEKNFKMSQYKAELVFVKRNYSIILSMRVKGR